MQVITLDNPLSNVVAVLPDDTTPYTRVYYDLNALVAVVGNDLAARRQAVLDSGDECAMAAYNGQVELLAQILNQRDSLMLEVAYAI